MYVNKSPVLYPAYKSVCVCGEGGGRCGVGERERNWVYLIDPLSPNQDKGSGMGRGIGIQPVNESVFVNVFMPAHYELNMQ